MMKSLAKIFFVLFIADISKATSTQTCNPPMGLKFQKFHYIKYIFLNNQFFSAQDENGFRLDVPDRHYRFDLDSWLATNQFNSCNSTTFDTDIHVRFPKRFILEKKFNLSGLMQFFLLFKSQFRIYLANLDAIEIDLGINDNSSETRETGYSEVSVIDSRFDFRLDGKPVETCQQFIDANLTEPKSIFQITPNHAYLEMYWHNPKFVRPLCPLLFKHARLFILPISGVVNTFYKQNLLSFTNDTFEYDLDSKIYDVTFLKRCENMIIDAKLLNRFVFSQIESNCA